MKNQANSKKSIISIIVIICAVAIGYFFYTGNKAPAIDSLLQTQATPEANAASSRIMNLLNQISMLEIDKSIFSNAVYMSLVDYSVEIPSVPVGRQNPFAPIPGASITQTP